MRRPKEATTTPHRSPEAASSARARGAAPQKQRSSSMIVMLLQPIAIGVLLGQGWHMFSGMVLRGSSRNLGLCVSGGLVGLLTGLLFCERAQPAQASLRTSLFWMSCTLSGGLSAVAQLRLHMGTFHQKDDALVVNLFLSSGFLGASLPQVVTKVMLEPRAEIIMPSTLALLVTEAISNQNVFPLAQVVVSLFLFAAGLHGLAGDPQRIVTHGRGAGAQQNSSTGGSLGHGMKEPPAPKLEPFFPATLLDARRYSPHWLVKRRTRSATSGSPIVELMPREKEENAARQRRSRDRGDGSGRNSIGVDGEEITTSRTSGRNVDRERRGGSDSAISRRGKMPAAAPPEDAEAAADAPLDIAMDEKPRADDIAFYEGEAPLDGGREIELGAAEHSTKDQTDQAEADQDEAEGSVAEATAAIEEDSPSMAIPSVELGFGVPPPPPMKPPVIPFAEPISPPSFAAEESASNLGDARPNSAFNPKVIDGESIGRQGLRADAEAFKPMYGFEEGQDPLTTAMDPSCGSGTTTDLASAKNGLAAVDYQGPCYGDYDENTYMGYGAGMGWDSGNYAAAGAYGTMAGDHHWDALDTFGAWGAEPWYGENDATAKGDATSDDAAPMTGDLIDSARGSTQTRAPKKAVSLLDPEVPDPGTGRASAMRKGSETNKQASASKASVVDGETHGFSNGTDGEGDGVGDPPCCWCYIDPHGQVQVGFTMEEMKQWHELGYFPDDLRLALVWSSPSTAKAPPRREFYEMRQWYPNIRQAFSYIPRF